MRGFNNLKQKLDALRNEGLPIAHEIEEAVQSYQNQAEETERALLEQQEHERQSRLRRKEYIKQR
ncbi:MAG: hypothetical protein AAGC93_03820 [Cyanobacteria bacterium P01_F01_bin.53]